MPGPARSEPTSAPVRRPGPPSSRPKDQAGQKTCGIEMYACIVHAPSVKLLGARIMTGWRNFSGNFVQILCREIDDDETQLQCFKPG